MQFDIGGNKYRLIPKTAIGMNEKPCGPLWERI
jgi:hypothetical protein